MTGIPSGILARTARGAALAAGLTVVGLALAAGCDDDPSAPRSADRIEGEIVRRNPDFGVPLGSDVVLRVLVKEDPDDGHECGIIFSVRAGTIIVVESGAGLASAGPDDLTVGSSVRVTFSGPLLESCPAQASADLIEVLSRG